MSTVSHDELVFRQSQPLDVKIKMSLERIEEWYNHWGGLVYVSFSGGKDSTVLLHLVRSICPEVPALFIDTGLEYPDTKSVVRQFGNVTRVRPKMRFDEVVDRWGWPVVSKRTAQYLYEAKPTGKNDKTVKLRTTGIGPDGRKRPFSKIPDKWMFLLDAPFAISHHCCRVMKKNPAKRYEKESGRHPFVGMLASDSQSRKSSYTLHGCNSFSASRPVSNPIAFWTEQDVLEYTVRNNLPLASSYGEIGKCDAGLCTSGIQSTGCMFCAFGVHLQPRPNRFEQMKTTHPKHYDYVINRLGLGQVLDYVGVPY